MIINMNGGGGAALNFRIVGGTTVPENPKENTIWVNTANKITSWALAFAEPSKPVEGMVWASISASGYSVFNALKKNTLAVSPMAVKQYVGDCWISRDGKIFHEQEWKDFVLWMVKDGETIHPLKVIGKKYSSDGQMAWTEVYSVPGDGFITVGGASVGYGIVYVEDIDLTHFKTLTIEGTFEASDDKYNLIVWDELGTYIVSNAVRQAKLPYGNATLSVDVSGLSGVHAVGISSASTSKHEIVNFWLS